MRTFPPLQIRKYIEKLAKIEVSISTKDSLISLVGYKYFKSSFAYEHIYISAQD